MRKSTYEQLQKENTLLHAELVDLRRQYAALEAKHQATLAEKEQLAATISDLQTRLEQVERASHRQAAPFRVPEEKRKRDPKKPGRKPGHPGSYRPRPDHVDEYIDVAMHHCPRCGRPIKNVTPIDQYIEEVPQVRAHVTHLVTYRGWCRECGEVASRHPMQVSDAAGAAGTHLGPNALGVAAELKQHVGLTMRKTCRVLELLGVHLSPGGLAQALHRIGRRLQPAYEGLAERLRSSPAVHADETSWWVGGPGWWLWVFTNNQVTMYRVEPGRSQQVVHEMLGDCFGGTLVSDCLSSYDPIDCKKHKCYSHHFRAIADGLAQRPDSKALRDMKTLLKTAQGFEDDSPLAPSDQRIVSLQTLADSLLGVTYSDPIEEHVANRLRKRREYLFTFLTEPGVDATNNLAERDLRPAVIARKISCGNKTVAGKRTWEILTSLAVTCQKQAHSFPAYVAASMPLLAPAARPP